MKGRTRPVAWVAYDQRAELGLHVLAAGIANLDPVELEALLVQVEARGAMAEFGAMAAEGEHDEQITADALSEENPSDAAAARARAMAWRAVRTHPWMANPRRKSRGATTPETGESRAGFWSRRLNRQVSEDEARRTTADLMDFVRMLTGWRKALGTGTGAAAPVDQTRPGRHRPLPSAVLHTPAAAFDDEVLACLREAGAEGLSRTALRDLFGRRRGSAELLSAALARLKTSGRVASTVAATAGRPAEIWRVA